LHQLPSAPPPPLLGRSHISVNLNGLMHFKLEPNCLRLVNLIKANPPSLVHTVQNVPVCTAVVCIDVSRCGGGLMCVWYFGTAGLLYRCGMLLEAGMPACVALLLLGPQCCKGLPSVCVYVCVCVCVRACVCVQRSEHAYSGLEPELG